MSQEIAANLPSLDPIVSLAKRRGFIFPSSEIYGGLASCYDYGPLGVLMLRNVKSAWWRSMVQLRDDVVGLDASILSGARSFNAQNGRSFQWLPRSLMVPLPKSHQRYHFGPGM